MKTSFEVGARVVCAVTGIPFRIKRQGCTLNAAQSSEGRIVSDKGVDISETRELLDRSRPFTCYVSEDAKHVTGWKGNVLGWITYKSTVRLTRMSFAHGRTMLAVHVRDVHGGHWYGRGSPGMCINLRPCKS